MLVYFLEEIESYEQKFKFSKKRIRQIGPIEWKREIFGAQKLRLHFLIRKHKDKLENLPNKMEKGDFNKYYKT